MKFLVITHTPHWEDKGLWAYGPYVREMNLWYTHCDEVVVVAPKAKKEKSKIHSVYHRKDVQIKKIPSIALISFRESLKTLCKLPYIIYVIYKEMRKADHIHLRCPGNIGLIGAIVQLLFPKKPKTVKYAGNWDPKSDQPFSYGIQKRILSNTRLSKNLKVLVYGEWPNQSKNILPFFTASYPESHKASISKVFDKTLRFMFVGSLVSGKRPEYAIELIKALAQKEYSVQLDIYGDGALRSSLEKQDIPFVHFYGNTKADIVYEAYKQAHFLILPSKSEGWPKVIAEAMFCGVIPIATPISCVPWMLDNGNRGQLMFLDLEQDCNNLTKLLENEQHYLDMSRQAQEWSQHYTLDSFEKAIKELLI